MCCRKRRMARRETRNGYARAVPKTGGSVLMVAVRMFPMWPVLVTRMLLSYELHCGRSFPEPVAVGEGYRVPEICSPWRFADHRCYRC